MPQCGVPGKAEVHRYRYRIHRVYLGIFPTTRAKMRASQAGVEDLYRRTYSVRSSVSGILPENIRGWVSSLRPAFI